VRLWLHDRLLVDQWQDQVATYDADVSLTQGYHWVRLEYYDSGGSAAVGLNWATLVGRSRYRLVNCVTSPDHRNHTGLVYSCVPCDQWQSKLMRCRCNDAVWHVWNC
jgi:hypothetical protein